MTISKIKPNMNIAVIGCGYWGKNLLRNFSELESLHAICDSSSERLKATKKDYPSVKTASSIEDILKDPDISAVAISTPAATHYELAKRSLLAGKDVFVEKPLSLTVREGEEIDGLAREKGRILMVGHLLEYHPGIMKLKELIGAGELGKINYVYSNRLNLGKIRREENILWSFAPHDISAMILLLGELPVSVYAQGGNYLHKDVADVTVSNFEFKSGVKAHIFVSWLHPYKEQKLMVVGEKRMALFNDVEEKDKLMLYDYKIRWSGGVPVSTKEGASAVPFQMREPLKEELSHFIECLRTRKMPKTDGDNGIRVLKVLESCQSSLEKNKVVML